MAAAEGECHDDGSHGQVPRVLQLDADADIDEEIGLEYEYDFAEEVAFFFVDAEVFFGCDPLPDKAGVSDVAEGDAVAQYAESAVPSDEFADAVYDECQCERCEDGVFHVLQPAFQYQQPDGACHCACRYGEDDRLQCSYGGVFHVDVA